MENIIELSYESLCRKRLIDNIDVVGRLAKHLLKKGWRIKSIVLDFIDWDSYREFLVDGGISAFVKHIRDYVDYHYGRDLRMEYFAFIEFQSRGVPHWHIYILTDRYVHLENFGGDRFFSRVFRYGYIYVKNVRYINIGYMVKLMQKGLESIRYFKEWCREFGLRKVKMFIRSIGLRKNFRDKFELLKIRSKLLRDTLGRLAKRWERVGNEYVFYFRNGVKVIVGAYWKYYYGRLLFQGAKVSILSPLVREASVQRFMNLSQYERFILFLFNKFKGLRKK